VNARKDFGERIAISTALTIALKASVSRRKGNVTKVARIICSACSVTSIVKRIARAGHVNKALVIAHVQMAITVLK